MITRLVKLNSLLLQLNGGKNSGNHNPGQGRGVGKPNGGTYIPIMVKDISTVQKRLSQALKKEDIDLSPEEIKDDSSRIYSEIFRTTHLDKSYAEVQKEICEKYGYDPDKDFDEIMETNEYREFQEARDKKASQRKTALLTEAGFPQVDVDAYYLEKDSYEQLKDDIETGKFANPKEKPDFKRRTDETLSFNPIYSYPCFQTRGYSISTGKLSLESDNHTLTEDDFVPSEWNKLMSNGLVKIDTNVYKKAIEQAVKSDKNAVHSAIFPSLDRPEERALKEYNLASAVNSDLRAGKTTKASTLIQSAINKSCTESQTVYRGLRGEFAEKVKSLKKGDTITDKGFMSTSYNLGTGDGKEGASQFGDTILQIKTKSGFGQGIDMTPFVGDSRFYSESEFLLQSGTTLKFTGESTVERWTNKDYEEKEKVKVLNFEVV
ncbi:MAG: hypothetical protein IJ122_06090 [Methanobrevibacter sp.]|nr:hypothetical protein [Methanobrevibacter sp.]